MKRLRAWLVYSVYVLLLGSFFVYILFPAEAVSRYVIAWVSTISPHVRMSIGDVSPILPPGLKLHRVTIAHQSGDLLEAPEIRLYPRWLSLFGKRPSLTYTALVGKGNIRGTATVTRSSAGPQIRLDADLDDVRLERLGLLQPVADYSLEGAVSGLIRYTGGTRQTADVRLTVAGMTVVPLRPVLGVRQLRFESVRAEAALENRNLRISRVTLAGEQINGELTGDVVLGRRLTDSTVSIGGTLQLDLKAEGTEKGPQPEPSGGGGLSLAGRVPVRISGTLGDPTVSLR